MKLATIFHQPSWTLRSDKVVMHLTRLGGHLGPVRFRLGRRVVQPYDVAPWAGEKSAAKLPALLRAMRGDFFCLPFGGNAREFRGEKHPSHGETAHGIWRLVESKNPLAAVWSIKPKARRGEVRKLVRLVPGHAAVYQRHEIRGMAGPMNPGHHAILKFPEAEGSGVISTSAFEFGQVYPGEFEDAAQGGYSALQPGAAFSRLDQVPLRAGGTTDLSRYPARRGYTDLVMMVSRVRKPFAWTAVTFPREGYVWFALKDPRVLRETVLWISHGGRHYAPWSGRHLSSMGLEEVTAYFHEGLAESAGANALKRRGVPTALALSAQKPTTINYIMAMAAIPRGFDRVQAIDAGDGEVVLRSASGKKVRAPLDWQFLFGSGTKV